MLHYIRIRGSAAGREASHGAPCQTGSGFIVPLGIGRPITICIHRLFSFSAQHIRLLIVIFEGIGDERSIKLHRSPVVKPFRANT